MIITTRIINDNDDGEGGFEVKGVMLPKTETL